MMMKKIYRDVILTNTSLPYILYTMSLRIISFHKVRLKCPKSRAIANNELKV